MLLLTIICSKIHSLTQSIYIPSTDTIFDQNLIFVAENHTVESLGLVSHGAATQGVTPIFSWNNWRSFSHHRLSLLQCHPYLFFSWKLATFFARHCRFYCFHLPVPSRLSTVRCKFSHKYIFFGCHPLEGVTRSGPPTPTPVTPLQPRLLTLQWRLQWRNSMSQFLEAVRQQILRVVSNPIHCFVANIKNFPAVKQFWKSVTIWRNYRHNSETRFFEIQCSNMITQTACMMWTNLKPSIHSSKLRATCWRAHTATFY